MKKIAFLIVAISFLTISCQKSAPQQSVSLNASSKLVAPGETVTVKANVVGANSLSWVVSPQTNVNSTYAITTETTNYFTFDQPGTYTIGVSTRNLPLDTIHPCNHFDHDGHHIPDSLWNHHVDEVWHAHDGDHNSGCMGHPGQGGGHGCHPGHDSATVVITVR